MSLPYEAGSAGLGYRVVDDERFLYQVVAAGRVLRQFREEGPAALQVRPSLERLQSRVLDGGFWAVSGYADQVFPNLGLAPYAFDVEFSAPGYRSTGVSVTLPAAVTLPVTVPDLRLEHDPVRIQGRVVDNAPDQPPIAGAVVDLEAADQLLLRTPVVFGHPPGAAVVESQLAAVGAVRTVVVPAVARATSIQLSDRSGLGAGSILRLGTEVATEYVVVDSLPTVPGIPDRVTLRWPLVRSVTAGAPAQPMTHTPGGVSAQLLEPSMPGEGALLLNAPMAGIDAVEVSSASGTEYHDLRALSDAQGFYRWDGVARLDNFNFRVSAAGFADRVIPCIVNYAQSVNVVNFRMLP